MAARPRNNLGTFLKRLTGSLFVWALVVIPALAAEYGAGPYGEGVYNVGEVSSNNSSAQASADSMTQTQAGGGVGGGRRGGIPTNTRASARFGQTASASSSSATSSNSSASARTSLPQQRGFLTATVNGNAMTFVDLPVESWFAPYVYDLMTAGIISGYRDANGTLTGLFKPANPVTYAEALKMALLASDTNLVPGVPNNHSALDDWSAPYVATAEALNLTVFTSALNVRIPATRGEVIVTLLEAFDIAINPDATHPFTDLPSTHPHHAAIATAFQLGIISGDTDALGTPTNTGRVDDPINRAETAKIVVGMMERVGE